MSRKYWQEVSVLALHSAYLLRIDMPKQNHDAIGVEAPRATRDPSHLPLNVHMLSADRGALVAGFDSKSESLFTASPTTRASSIAFSDGNELCRDLRM